MMKKHPIDSYRLEKERKYLVVIHNMTNQSIPYMTQILVNQGLDSLKVTVHAHKNPLLVNQTKDGPTKVRYTFEGELDKLILTMFEDDI